MGNLVRRLRGFLENPDLVSQIDDVRALLVLAGQFEQAVHDLLPGWTTEVEAVTDAAAHAFLALWAETQPSFGGEVSSAAESLEDMSRALSRIPELSAEVLVKMPEGFSFYTLYPDAYCASAVRWVADHPVCGRARVVGLRTIGTTLSAVVAATLSAFGWEADRMTCRPTGHPYARELFLGEEAVSGYDQLLIVDEGPGQSGSSIAAVAEAAVRVGFPRDRIAFFPSHSGEPGEQASESVRRWWAETPRYVIDTDDLRWRNRSLRESLAEITLGLQSEVDVVRVEDLSAGQWREIVYDDPQEWPEVATQFEKTKYRMVLSDGSAVLWKFAGLVPLPRSTDGLAADWTAPVLGSAMGFVATPWIEGKPADRDSLSSACLAEYLLASTGPPLMPTQARHARERLDHWLYWNTAELCGEDAAKRMAEFAASVPIERGPSYTDSHLAPHEWVQPANNRALRASPSNYMLDHTIVGVQPLTWAVAAAIVEWNLESEAAEGLLNSLAEGGIIISREQLSLYRLAYLAFTGGLALRSDVCGLMGL